VSVDTDYVGSGDLLHSIFYPGGSERRMRFSHCIYIISSNEDRVMGHDLTPMFQDEIDAEILDVSLEKVSSDGWVGVNEWQKYHNHAVVFAHFVERGQLKTTHYDGQKKRQVQNFVQKDGGINIGTEEWQGRQLLLAVLDQKVPTDE
jgi:hypothetical protein